MWIFVKQGFFSIGCASDSDGFPDPTLKMIRARCPHQLQRLKARYSDILGSKEIVHTYETDYSYRILLYTSDFDQLMRDIGDDIDYSNFKDVALCNNPADFQFIHFLHKVWEWWYLLKGGFEQKPRKKKKKRKGKRNEHTKKFSKKKNGGPRRKARTPTQVL